jgi:uncharacterized membrane protein YphA (DoxX/SURF4 family)
LLVVVLVISGVLPRFASFTLFFDVLLFIRSVGECEPFDALIFFDGIFRNEFTI